MRPTHHLVLNVRFRVTKSTVKVKSCGKGPSISIYFDCKLASSGYTYPLNIAKSPRMVLRDMLHRLGLFLRNRAKVAARVCVALAITVDIIRSHRAFV